MVEFVASIHNKRIKHIRKLLMSREIRHDERHFVAEGIRVVSDIAEHDTPHELVCAERVYKKLPLNKKLYARLQKHNVPVIVLKDSVFNAVSSLTHSDGIIGVFNFLTFNKNDHFNKNTLCAVLCEELQDPTNVGAIIRNCYALGADMLILTDRSVDIYNPKFVRASASYMTRLPVVYSSLREVTDMKKHNRLSIWVGQSSGSKESKPLLPQTIMPQRVMFAFGNEGRGVSKQLLALADKTFHIPMVHGCNSLNIAAAVAITVYMGMRGNKNK